MKPSFVVMAALLLTAAGADETRITLDAKHLDRILHGTAKVAEKAPAVADDPMRPAYHVLPAAALCGDPNGPMYVNGRYHLFFQHAPAFEWGKPAEEWDDGSDDLSIMGWGHASSADLAHWRREPIALMPEPDSYDPSFIASGCAVVADDGTPTIFYTAAEPQTVCIARSEDPKLHYWLKDADNPIIHQPEQDGYIPGGFRDPFIWREGDTWRLIICSAIEGVGGAAPYFESKDLEHWEYVKPFAAGMGEHCTAWEMPNFLRFGDMGVLIVSPLFDNREGQPFAPRGDVVYTTAPYGGDGDFTPAEWKPIDLGGPGGFYATMAMQDPQGRWLVWGMNMGGGSEEYDWSGNISLPRVITLRNDGRLGQAPAPELAKLRGKHWGQQAIRLDGAHVLDVKSNTCEIIAEIEVGDADVVGLEVRGSEDFSTRTRIAFDVRNGKLSGDAHSGDFELLEGEDVLRLHAFVDRSIIETFINGREAITLRPFHDIAHNNIRLFSEGGAAHIRSVDVWEMHSAWEEE